MRKSEEILKKVEEGKEGMEEKKVQMVAFSLATEFYILDVQYVREILNMTGITHVPRTPEFILGVIDLRGDIISVIDIRKILGLEVECLKGSRRIIIVEVDTEVLGITVDSVIDVMEIEIANIQPPLLTIEKGKKDYIDGEIEISGRLFNVLNIKNIIASIT
ncbi:MAG: chemotaxis protein CheW [bacterium]|nr:chemotaxis protein CheW [bacterium]